MTKRTEKPGAKKTTLKPVPKPNPKTVAKPTPPPTPQPSPRLAPSRFDKFQMKWWMVAAPLAFLIAIFYFVQYLTSPARLAQGDLRARFNLQTLGAIPYPPDNPARPERIELGRLLFFDPILSGEKDVACGTCHNPDFAFADRRQFGAGASGMGLGPSRLLSRSAVTGDPINLEPRNTPTVFNVGFHGDVNGVPSHLGLQFLDGRVDGLEKQALKPITSRVEMRGDALPGTDEEAVAAAPAMVIERLRAIPEYVRLFQNAFPEEKLTKPGASIIDEDTYGRALASYQRELVTRNSAYDRYVMGDDNALTDVQKKGMVLFFTKGQCADCHSGAMFSDFSFVVQGVPQEGTGKKVLPGDDTGREEFTLDPVDRYAFRTLTLRNVELTPPYMHDGVFQTLEEVVRFYNDGGQPRHPEVTDVLLDARLKDSRGNAEKLGLNDSEIFALVEFMKALTDPGTQLPEFLITVPEKVPSGLAPLFGVKAEQTQTPASAACLVRADAKGMPAIVAEPLRVASSSSSTLLSEIMANQSGLDFVNRLSRENQKKYTSNGAGLAAGDFDNDGLTDVFIVSEEGQSKLYRNLGAFKFEDATARAGLSNTRDEGGFTVGAYFADIDNDGDLDLFLTNWQVSNRLFVNNGDGTFKDATDMAGVAYAGGSTTVTFADYDRDCDLDFFVATYRPRPLEFEMSDALQLENGPDGMPIIPEAFQERLGAFPKPDGGARIYQLGERDLLYKNNGDGTFSEVAQNAGIAGNFWGLSAMFADIDNDQWPDLYITNDFWSPDGFYRNRGDGTFEPVHAEMIQHTSMYSMGLDFGDINNDGYSDFFVGDMMSRDPVLQLTQHGGPMVEPPAQFAAPAQIMRNTLYLNNGDGSFSDIAFLADLADTEWTWSSKFADIDLDGFVDLLITNGMLFDVMDSDFVAEQNRLNEEVGFQAAQDHVYQFPRLDDPSMVFRNRGDLTFEDVSKEWGFYKRSVDMGMALADFDSDGDWDIAISPINEPIILFENTSETPRLVVKLRGRVSNAQGLGARVILTTERGTQTRVVSSSGGYLSSHEAVAIFGLGDATEIRELRIEWPSGHVQTFPDNSSGSLAADTRYIVTEPAAQIQPAPAFAPILPTQFKEVGLQAGLSDAHVESAYDPFMDNHILPRSLASLGPGVAWADVDADGDDDLYLAGARGQSGMLFINTNGSFSKSETFMSSADNEGMAALFWNDGISSAPELLLSLSKIESPAPLVTRINAASAGKWQANSPASGGALASADFDGDGDLDLFTGGRAIPNQWPKSAPSYLFENQNGNLVDVTSTRSPDLASFGQATAALWLDVDSDRDPDLLVAAEWGPVRLFLNSGGTLQPAPDSGLDTWSGLWTGLTASDFDGDGDLDFAAANLGLNTHYRATPTHPLIMFAGDVDSNGTHDIIETKWVGDVLHPLIERGMMGMEVPFVLEKFPTFRGYAEATLEEIFGDGLQRVTRYEATTLAHSVFLNDGAGQFTRADLPLLSQTMAGYGIASADFDNDGFDDLYLAGNFSAADMMTVAYEGGTSYLLRGRGDGTFDAIPSRESGLLVPYDARGVAVSDYDRDGWADILVGVNNMRPLLFRNGGRDSNGSVTIRLQGTAVNPTGVGARVTVTRDDGASSTREVLLGSGYLSQDSAALVFGMGKAATATITVVWPDGHVTVMENVRAGEQVTITP